LTGRPGLNGRSLRRASAASLCLAIALASAASSLHAAEPAEGSTPAVGSAAQRHAPLHVDRQPIDQPPAEQRPAQVAVDRPAAVSAEQGAALQRALYSAHAAVGAYGVSFAAFRDGTLIWAGATGVERDGRTALTPDRPLVIGSVMKTFVCALILQLVQEGRLALDQPVSTLLPDAPATVAPITVRQLLGHSSGLADVYNETTKAMLEMTPERSLAPTEILATLPAPWFAPGASWTYSNTNYMVLGLIAERVLGRSLADAIETRLAEPLGLSSAHALDPADTHGPLRPAWASVFYGSGAMAANATDVAAWGDELYGGDVLTAETRALMLTFNEHDTGLGVQRLELGTHKGYGHSGLMSTYTSLLVYLPEADVTVAVLVNLAHADISGMLTFAPQGGTSLLDLTLGAATSTATSAAP
jgi:D-alanyl-D-alanine carboxypeptidase